VVSAGAEIIVAGSAIFGTTDPKGAVEDLREATVSGFKCFICPGQANRGGEIESDSSSPFLAKTVFAEVYLMKSRVLSLLAVCLLVLGVTRSHLLNNQAECRSFPLPSG
jgi:Pentose-5-phosphate-3-epimerase